MKQPEALLFDLGNVIVDLDPSRVFAHWGETAAVDPATLAARWTIDDAYRQHETGQLDFHAYTQHLSNTLHIDLAPSQWRDGWNALFLGTFPMVNARLASLASALPCFCYTNTNPTHQTEWQANYSDALLPFRKVYVSSDIGRRKPDASSFNWVANDMGYDPTEIQFIDDSPENVAGARRVGMSSILARGEAQVLAALATLPD